LKPVCLISLTLVERDLALYVAKGRAE
jgi:hypothetical protein